MSTRKEKLKNTADGIANDAVKYTTRLMTRITFLQDGIPEDEFEFDEKLEALFNALDAVEDAAIALEGQNFIFP